MHQLFCRQGLDATEAFDEIGHSDDARDLLKEMYLGDLIVSVRIYQCLLTFEVHMKLSDPLTHGAIWRLTAAYKSRACLLLNSF